MMQRELINARPGSPEWDSFRLTIGGASEAAAMLGMSPYVTRSELIARKASGVPKEFSEWFQANVLDKGHEIEAKARPIAEKLIEDDLYPLVYRLGIMGASCDGLTMDGQTAWENKQWNAEDAELVGAGILPEKHVPQCQQILCVTGARRLLFTITDGTEDGTAWLWVHPADGWPEKLEAGWRQFFADVAAYVPTVTEAKAVGKTMDSLPALRVLVKGEVTDTNIDQWAGVARAVLGSINRTLNTDQDFADAENAVKWCEKQEQALEAAKQHALSQTETIDKLFKTIDAIKEETRAIRLEQEKLVTQRKAERKSELVSERVAAWHSFIRSTNDTLAPYRLPLVAVDFPIQIKNKRSFAAMADALDTELARAKIEATNIAQRIEENAKIIKSAHEYAFLFSDAAELVLKDSDAVSAIVSNRMIQHEAELKRKAEEAAEREREKIREQERAKLEAEEKERVRQVEAAERRRQGAEALAERQLAEADLKKLAEQSASKQSAETVASVGLDHMECAPLPGAGLPNLPGPLATEETANLNLGAIADRLGFRLDSTFIGESLGVPFRRQEKAARFWTESDYLLICDRLIAHIERTKTPF